MIGLHLIGADGFSLDWVGFDLVSLDCIRVSLIGVGLSERIGFLPVMESQMLLL